ncbi:plastocyanin [Methylobacterium sp. J-076]|uniref:plastocyanin n=1 Tax=Methylobacterium sp. J-076 TaxID=2836655 RepID=UPI001FBBB9C5|nr:plastocyanin [Methylobacterium sp. J-076]MCJ2015507.1 plastocyanin [Methylobacterium sp. J-076]
MARLVTVLPVKSRRAIVVSALLSLGLGAVAGLSVIGGLQASGIIVSQKGRTFHPDSLTVGKGETVMIVNDDSDLLHHAYIDSPTFSFDSGDQEPGSRTPITFTQTGVFQVLCGIHPKMKLVVRVN